MKHISCIEGVENLRALIRHELHDFGIKVPKGKKTRRQGGTSKDVGKTVGLFGNYLANVPCVYVPECGYVSKFLVDAASFINEHIEHEGIFRKSGSLARQKELKQDLEDGKGLSGANVHDVATLVKQFFRELPEPLFSSVYHDTFVRCYHIEDAEVATKAILLLCLLLPGEHISTLRFTLQLLSKISSVSDKNKMDTNNLAVVLAPNIMYVNNKSVKMNSSEEKLLQVQTSVVELLIQNADLVGMVDDELATRTAFMSEVFSTDDELDASEDNLEDSKDTRKKEKKRKRSGSFQGFVSSIAQSITKWRRSTDGKTNTSNLSQASNASNASKVSHQGKGNISTKSEDVQNGSTTNPVQYQFSITDATPIVRRKKTANTDNRAFSASKKKAILQQLPNHAALASTPFTPASTMKKLDINSARRIVGDTPGIPIRPHATPRHCMKTPRKKLALFSPGSSMKKKRYSSSNLSLQSASKKSVKTKGIFRRLSGSKGDQFPAPTTQGNQTTAQIGQRLASPTATANGSVLDSSDMKASSQMTDHTISDESPIAAIMHNSNISASFCEQSVISAPGDVMSLNEGFILNGDDKDIDISMLGDPDKSEMHGSEENNLFGGIQRGSKSDTTLNNQTFDTPSMLSAHNRSYSAEGNLSYLDGSMRKSSLKRGQPNSVKAGLLQGDHSEVQKLRRSFGLDKSDIGFPIPVSVPSLCDEDVSPLDSTVDMKSESQASHSQGLEAGSTDSPGSVSQCRQPSSCSIAGAVPKQTSNKECNSSEATGYDSDGHSECGFSTVSAGGFSTISGGTAIFNPVLQICPTPVDQVMEKCSEFIVRSDPPEKKLSDQKADSVDSLFSEVSSCSPQGVVHKEMTRSISADSGKGSMIEEPMNDESNQIGSSKSKDTKLEPTSEPDTFTKFGSASKPQKSLSTQDLQREGKISTPVGVYRSKSLLDSSMSRRNNIKPNLQISAETHKLLARAGYIRDQKPPTKEKQDFAIPGTLIKPMERDKILHDCSPTVNDSSKHCNSTESAENSNNKTISMEVESVSSPAKVDMDTEMVDEEDFVAFPTDHDFAVPTTIPTIKQSSELINPRRESILALREKNAGHVANNIKQFDQILLQKHSSPLRFSQSTSRKCMSPITIPTVFCSEKLSYGTARVPISTQLIKPSGPVCDQTETNKKSSQIKRKPSIYYAGKEGSGVPKSMISGQYPSPIPEESSPLLSMEVDNKSQNNGDIAKPQTNLFEKALLDGQSVDLNKSLQDTIDMVCTPLSQQVCRNSDRIVNINKENQKTDGQDLNVQQTEGSKMPTIKPSVIATPLLTDTFSLRTASNKTPIELLKTSRSPVKPLKRLGSPRSPRCRTNHSPNRSLTKRPRLTTVLSGDSDVLNNL